MDKILFLISAFLLVWGLRLQSDPSSASKGNKLAALGMMLAIFSSVIMPIDNSYSNILWIIVPITFSAIFGYTIANKIKMTSMPQMVSIFNGLGGLSAVLLSYTEINKWINLPESYEIVVVIVLILSLFIVIISMFIGDLVIGFHNTMIFTYSSLILAVAIGILIARINFYGAESFS